MDSEHKTYLLEGENNNLLYIYGIDEQNFIRFSYDENENMKYLDEWIDDNWIKVAEYINEEWKELKKLELTEILTMINLFEEVIEDITYQKFIILDKDIEQLLTKD